MSTLEGALAEERMFDTLDDPQQARRRPFARYMVWLAALPLFAYLATFPLMMTPRLPHLGFSKFGPVLDYGYNIHHLDADVVIFGDSSAFLGVDPRRVQAETGIRSVVLPNTVGSLPTIGDLALQRYLKYNRTPRLLVLYFSPWSLDYNDPNWVGLNFEGEEELLRNGSLGDAARFAAHHPFEFLKIPFRAYITFGIRNAVAYFHDPDRLSTTAAAFGHQDYTLPYGPVAQPCWVSPIYMGHVKDDTVLQLARKYQQMHIPVMVYLAPIPNCVGSAEVAARTYAGLQTVKPTVEPASWFADDSYLAHIRPGYVPQSSHLFANALRSWAEQEKTEGGPQSSQQH